MEPTATQPAAAPAQPAPAANSAMSANNIIVTLFTGIITGFAIGLGLILSQKVTKKNVIVETKGDSSSANGNPSVMYAPRMQRPPMGMTMRPPMGYGYGMPYGQGYAQIEGSKQSFDVDAWLHGKNKNNDDLLANIQD